MDRLRLRRGALALGTVLFLEVTCRFLLGNMSIAQWEIRPADGRCLGLRPGGEVVYTGWRWRTPPVIHQANRMGYRGPERPDVAPSGVFRVVAVGDSFTYGQGVSLGDDVPSLLEEALGGASTAPIEVMNFGIPGLSLAEIVDQFEKFAVRWQPDLVLGVLSGNDLGKPICDLVGQPVKRWMLKNVYLFRVGYIGLVGKHVTGEPPLGPADRLRLASELARFRAATDDAGASLALLALSDPAIEVGGVGPVAEALGIPFKDLRALQNPEVYPRILGEGHLNPEANRRVAAAAASWLLEATLVPSSPARPPDEGDPAPR